MSKHRIPGRATVTCQPEQSWITIRKLVSRVAGERISEPLSFMCPSSRQHHHLNATKPTSHLIVVITPPSSCLTCIICILLYVYIMMYAPAGKKGSADYCEGK